MKKIVILVVALAIIAGLIIGGYLMIDSLFPKADPINVPSASSVVSMTVKKNENRNDGDLREIANADVDSILSKLSEAEPTRKMSVQDSPDAQTYYEIAAKTNERTHYFYIYFENGTCYAEIPYEGIYTVDNGLVNLLPTGAYRNDEKVKIINTESDTYAASVSRSFTRTTTTVLATCTPSPSRVTVRTRAPRCALIGR